jgi:hypothetical protein
MGANATPMPYGEVYTALKVGTVDGAENNWPSYDTSRHFEVAKYYAITDHSMAPEMLLMSKKIYDGLTPDEQKIIRDAAKASVPYMRKLWDEKELESRKKVEAGGAQVVEVDKKSFSDAMKPVYDKFITDPKLKDMVLKVQATHHAGRAGPEQQQQRPRPPPCTGAPCSVGFCAPLLKGAPHGRGRGLMAMSPASRSGVRPLHHERHADACIGAAAACATPAIGMESLLVLVSEKSVRMEIVIHGLVGLFGALMAYNGALLAISVMDYNIPTLGIPEGLNHVPVAIAGALILLFSIEHIVAIFHGTEVEPAWH